MKVYVQNKASGAIIYTSSDMSAEQARNLCTAIALVVGWLYSVFTD